MLPVIAITALNFVYMSAYMCYFPTLPIFVKESAIGLLIGVSALTALGTRPSVGYLIDRIGRKPLLVAGMFIFTVHALLCSLPTSPEAAVPVRLGVRLRCLPLLGQHLRRRYGPVEGRRG